MHCIRFVRSSRGKASCCEPVSHRLKMSAHVQLSKSNTCCQIHCVPSPNTIACHRDGISRSSLPLSLSLTHILSVGPYVSRACLRCQKSPGRQYCYCHIIIIFHFVEFSSFKFVFFSSFLYLGSDKNDEDEKNVHLISAPYDSYEIVEQNAQILDSSHRIAISTRPSTFHFTFTWTSFDDRYQN